MNNARLMRRVERRRHLPDDVHRFTQIQPAIDQPLAQRDAVNKFHGDEMNLPGLADLINCDDVRMIERGGGAGFAPEALQAHGVLSELRRQQLERDVAFELLIARQPDLAHPARAEQR